MIITLPWLKEHLKTKANENEILDILRQKSIDTHVPSVYLRSICPRNYDVPRQSMV